MPSRPEHRTESRQHGPHRSSLAAHAIIPHAGSPAWSDLLPRCPVRAQFPSRDRLTDSVHCSAKRSAKLPLTILHAPTSSTQRPVFGLACVPSQTNRVPPKGIQLTKGSTFSLCTDLRVLSVFLVLCHRPTDRSTDQPTHPLGFVDLG